MKGKISPPLQMPSGYELLRRRRHLSPQRSSVHELELELLPRPSFFLPRSVQSLPRATIPGHRRRRHRRTPKQRKLMAPDSLSLSLSADAISL